jgi:catalase
MQWDFWTLSPESAHQVTWLMGDRGIPKTWRQLNGYSSHTYLWENAGGEKFWVKYHFKTDQGIDFWTQADAEQMAGTDPDYHIRDLHESIAKGEYPSWTLKMQIMPFAEAADYRFNPFDLTKVWPHADYPLHEVGRFVLDRNPENYFAEVEQAAFEPANMVPGIGASPDKMLLGRLFSYPDTHRHRIGANYLQLPINQPKSPVHSYNRDGAMRYQNPGDPVYAPNSYGGPKADPSAELPSWQVDAGEIGRYAYTKHRDDDDFIQPGTMYRNVLDEAARERLANNIAGHVRGGVVEPVLSRVIQYWTSVDPGLGANVAAKVGYSPAPVPAE